MQFVCVAADADADDNAEYWMHLTVLNMHSIQQQQQRKK